MTPEDVGRVLAAAALRDYRDVDPLVIAAWHEDIGDLDADDALAAVSRHYRQTTDRLMPAHVRRLAAEIDRERRRAEREAREQSERRAIEADPSRRDRSEDVRRLIAELREALPEGDPDKLRRTEVLGWERQREREQRPDAAPNLLYDPSIRPGDRVLCDCGAIIIPDREAVIVCACGAHHQPDPSRPARPAESTEEGTEQ